MMNTLWKEILWRQFGAAIETLEYALNACPEELWQARLWRETEGRPEFTESGMWPITPSSGSTTAAPHRPRALPRRPFTLSEPEMDGALPERVYSQAELRAYLAFARAKCRTRIAGLDDENETQRVRDDWGITTVAELLLYTMRHVQEHAAHLSMLLGQHTDVAPGWVGQAKND